MLPLPSCSAAAPYPAGLLRYPDADTEDDPDDEEEEEEDEELMPYGAPRGVDRAGGSRGGCAPAFPWPPAVCSPPVPHSSLPVNCLCVTPHRLSWAPHCLFHRLSLAFFHRLFTAFPWPSFAAFSPPFSHCPSPPVHRLSLTFPLPAGTQPTRKSQHGRSARASGGRGGHRCGG